MMRVVKYLTLVLIIFQVFSACSVEKTSTQESKIQVALNKLKNKTYPNAWLVISSGFNGKFIQFYSYNNEVYFDFPLYSEIKNEYKDERHEGKIDSTTLKTFFINYLPNSQLFSLKKLLHSYKIDFEEVRVGFIEPTFNNQTDTTGWETTIRGIFTIDFSKTKEFIDEYFSKVYGIKTETISYLIEEN